MCSLHKFQVYEGCRRVHQLSVTQQSRYGGAQMIVMRRAQRPLLLWLHCASLREGAQNPILRSVNSRAGRGRSNNSRGLGVPCIAHSERPAFGSSRVPHQILNLLSVTSGGAARPGRVKLLTAAGLLVIRCCCNRGYPVWEKV